MFPHRHPLPTFTLALSSLPKRDSLDGRRDSQRDIFSGYYASLVVPRDLMRTVRPQSWNDYGFNFPPVRCLLDFLHHVLTFFSLMSLYWKMNLRQKHSSMIRTNVFLFTQTRAVGLGGGGE
ncbi:hypothetical protein K443DRAFT_534521 [Laccaria amethystina LaAM-08-1]|uniref:Uncharacterized protein n=1 Tax=Laccaria amethystina LaAM-08-1 TaxID=1095629 RepID=A0A0C9YL26_9AGAR|nr:hypothetical protein K443DRAFT_534521 [Laccaria amethystina LaAM-08-1]